MIYEVSVNQESEKETGIIYFIPVFLKYIYKKIEIIMTILWETLRIV